jgi:hypothetical protein
MSVYKISRRAAIGLGAAVATSILTPSGRAASNNGIIAGAIRWDAWEATKNAPLIAAVTASLGPSEFRERAPFCSTQTTDSISFSGCDAQRVMDMEIGFAASSGISYWAYCWYGSTDPMMNAWAHHQASVRQNSVNWCLLLQFSRLGGREAFSAIVPEYVAFFGQHNYQRVVDGRPLVYIFIDQPNVLASDWGDSWGEMRAALADLTAACARAGSRAPYIVIMSGIPTRAREIMVALGADAISNYISRIPPGQPASYTALDTVTRAYWAEMAATGVPIVPICMTGWDVRPRKLHPPPWQPDQTPGVGMDTYVAAGTPAQIGTHIRAAINYIKLHKGACPADVFLIYSWDECDEGGSPLVPTYRQGSPNHSILDAVGAALRGR